MKLILNILFIGVLLPLGMYGQDYDGVWRMGYEKSPTNLSVRLYRDYQVKNVIFQFQTSDTSLTKSFVDEKNNCFYYQQTSEGIIIEIDSLTYLKGQLSNNLLILKKIYKNREYNHSVWEKLPPNSFKLDEVPFQNSILKIHSDSSAIFDGLNIHLTKDSTAYFTYNAPLYKVTNTGGIWAKATAAGTVLTLWDNRISERFCFLLQKSIKDTIYADTYINIENPEAPPKKVTVKIVSLPLPKKDFLKRIEKKLVGTFKATNQEMLDLGGFMGHDSLRNLSIELELSANGRFSIKEAGDVLINKSWESKEGSRKGKWSLSKSGYYLILTEKGYLPRYVTINVINPQRLTLSGEFMETLSPFGFANTLFFLR